MQTTLSLVTLLLSTVVSATPLMPRNGAPINAGSIALIEKLEGFEANYYNDVNGEQTIGYGHDCVQLKDCGSLHPPLTQAQGTALLMKDLTSYESCVCAMPNAAKLNANQYGALVSFTYNSGCGALSQFFAQDLASANFAGICGALPTTNTKGGEVTTRRQQEGVLCGTPTGALSGCVA